MTFPISSREWRIIFLCSLVVLLLAYPTAATVQWTRNGDYVTDDLSSLLTGEGAGNIPAGTEGAVAISSVIDTDRNEYWLNLSPIRNGKIGSFGVMGTTNLLPETNLSLNVFSNAFHPTPWPYDWSHERAGGHGKVFRSGSKTLFSGSVNTSRLYPGEYYLSISTSDSKAEASVFTTIDMIPTIPTTPGRMHAINWSRLTIPTLHTFDSIRPGINSWWKVVRNPRLNKGDLSYGSVIYCAWDGICRVYDKDGIQYYAAYDGVSITGVPSGSCISDDDNVLTVSLDGCNNKIVLTKIYEHMWDWE
ncbi:MAG: hypothetical protein LUQ66_08535 [Methanoregula sp.]|nr:hypothetical protein [Methanoregula sp.]